MEMYVLFRYDANQQWQYPHRLALPNDALDVRRHAKSTRKGAFYIPFQDILHPDSATMYPMPSCSAAA